MAAIEKVKILVLGDSGVGKSSLTHLIAHNEAISKPLWTVGCSVDVKLHEYKEGTQYQKTYFIELWDIGGSSNHKSTRSVFYNSVHGMILVHDLTNRKSQHNLQYWLNEVVNSESCKNKQPTINEFDTEQFAGTTLLPMIVVGTKMDLIEENRLHENSDVAQEWGADKIYLNCGDSKSLAPGNSSSVKLSRFFDKVIEIRYNTRDILSPYSADKRRNFSSSLVGGKLYHND